MAKTFSLSMASPFSARASTAAMAYNGKEAKAAQDDEVVGGGSCPRHQQCKIIERIPSGHGLMIMLNDENNTSKVIDSSSAKDNTTKKCSCLKLQSQKDTNLTSIHPNIYIPSPLTSFPSHLKRYSGGGSGVTVFGGYHPQLGSLVMKHGGYKDLIELVSLAKIEREVVVRGSWKIDCLVRRRDQLLLGQMMLEEDGNREGECGYGWLNTVHESPAIRSATVKDKHDDETGKKIGVSSMHTVFVTSAKSSSKLSKKSLLNKISTTLRNIFTTSPITPTRRYSQQKLQQQQQQQQQQVAQINEQITQIQNAMSQIQQRIPAFKMIYISPMHLRERECELVHSAKFRESMMKRRHAFKITRNILDGSVESDDDEDDESEKKRVLSNCKNNITEREEEEEEEKEENLAQLESMSMSRSMRRTSRVIAKAMSTVCRKGRDIHVFGADHVKSTSFDVAYNHVDVCFGGSFRHKKRDYIFNEEDDDDNDNHDGSGSGSAGYASSTAPANESSLSPTPHSCQISADGSDGYSTLMAFVHQFQEHQKVNEWKITLAQQTIGTTFENGDINKPKSARTAASLLYEGKLQGKLLMHLIDEEIQMIRNMQLLTMPEETNVVEQVRKEYDDILSRQQRMKGGVVSAENVSDLMNDFVGKAIHKNFHPKHGRFVMLRQFGRDLRHEKIHLTEEEFVPAMHLENLFCNHFDNDEQEFHVGEIRKVAGETFSMMTEDVPGPSDIIEDGVSKVHNEGVGSTLSKSLHHRRSICDHPIFASGLSQWQSLLELSLSMKHPNTRNRVWTCGLTDGGLHNLFLGEDQMWAFDLGEPSLEPIPAFLTKFLMSFFHALGMEEDEKGDWVVRFEQEEGKLKPTEATKKLFPQIVHSFNITVDRLITELFGGEEEVRTLLVRYVVTQLISDAAFCIEKWKTKGGGDASRSDHQRHLEKWLWRALWDVYASEELRRIYLTRLIMIRQQGCWDLGSSGSI